MTPSLVVEDHCQAYGFWKELGIRGATCIHVDAHLDVMDRGFSPEVLAAVAQSRGRSDLEELSPPPYLPWGGIHCGNYLYPALREGIVDHLIWVVPQPMVKDVPLLDFARDELLNWVEMKLPEFQSLHSTERRVEGTLGGVKFTLCTSSNLPPLQAGSPLLLDIDIDYFQDINDEIWQSPGELKAELNLTRHDVLTVAVSVDGGYTALENRYLAEVTQRIFLGENAAEWETNTQALLAADRERLHDPTAYDRVNETSDSAWWCATLALKRGLAQGQTPLQASRAAQEFDSRFTASKFNEALVEARHERLENALNLLNEDEEQLFMRAILALKGGAPERSQHEWERFLSLVELGPAQKAHALFMLGQAYIQLERAEDAARALTEAVDLEPCHFQYLLFLGLAQQLTGDLKKASKTWRKALADHPDSVACVELHLELARLYRDLDRAALAEAEIQRLRRKDSTGAFRLTIEMEQLRWAHSRPGESIRGLWRSGLNLVGVHR